MSFDFLNWFLQIQDSIETLILKVKVNLGVCGFIPSHFLNVAPELHSKFAPFHALALFTSPMLRS
jgi:hypothetical protein